LGEGKPDFMSGDGCCTGGQGEVKGDRDHTASDNVIMESSEDKILGSKVQRRGTANGGVVGSEAVSNVQVGRDERARGGTKQGNRGRRGRWTEEGRQERRGAFIGVEPSTGGRGRGGGCNNGGKRSKVRASSRGIVEGRR
jgi:hypothetical protein